MHRSANRRFAFVFSILLSFVGLLGLLVANQSAWAQSSNGQVTGLVTDSTGAAMLEAEVTATFCHSCCQAVTK
jgi:hypothetical protein